MVSSAKPVHATQLKPGEDIVEEALLHQFYTTAQSDNRTAELLKLQTGN